MLRRLFTLIVCLVAATATASAQTPPYNEIWYTTTDGRPLFINSGYKKSVDLYMYSDTYNNGRGVLKFKSGGYINFINSGLFDDNDRLKSITIPNSVTSIGEEAFWYCSSLTSITIPNSVKSIGYSAFSGCSSLTSITIPNSVTSIEQYTFQDCSNLKSITIPDSVTSIEYGAFYGCSSLTSITIPGSVTEIGSWVFEGCSRLKSVKVANKDCYDYFKKLGVSDIIFIVSTLKEYEEAQKLGATKLAIDSNSKYASEDGLCLIDNGKLIHFIGKDLTEYTIPESVTSIGKGAFQGCSSLTSITIPNSVTSIGYRAFAGCSSLTSITIPNSVTKIGSDAFTGCSSLTSITIPDSVTSIGKSAFAGCSSLTSITIPNSVTSIGSGAFEDCSSIKSVKVANEYCYDYFKDEVDDIAFYGANASDDGRCLIVSGELQRFIAKGITEYTIPESVTSIGEEAFEDCISLTSITIPNSVTSIGESAFRGCSSLKSVKVANKYCYDYFKDKVANIAFYGANASADGRCIIVNGELQRFIGKGITEYTIPESVTSIGSGAFAGCSSLPVIDNIRYADTYLIEAVDKSLTSYSIKEGTRLIGGSAFNDCSSLKSITIPNSVTSFGDYAFYDCDSLTSITCLATTPPAIDDLRIGETTMIYVPKEAVKAYKKDLKWSIYKKQIKAIK